MKWAILALGVLCMGFTSGCAVKSNPAKTTVHSPYGQLSITAHRDKEKRVNAEGND